MLISWLLIALVLISAEFFVPGVVIIFFGIGAFLMFIITLLGSEFSILTGTLLWLGASLSSLFLMRPFFKKFMGNRLTSHENDYADGAQIAKVLETIEPEKPGRISYGGTSWKALSFDKTFKPGDEVCILKKEGMSYYVAEPFFS